MRAIILDGGRGTRLRPYTHTLPKQLMQIGEEMPILEIILKQLKKKGFEEITLAVNYLAKIFKALFNDGDEYGLKIDYSLEKNPLGTVGPLTLINNLPDNFLVLNGDILTDLDFERFFNWHIENNNDISVATFKKVNKYDLGIIKYKENQDIYEFEEKPIFSNDISMGVYVLNKKVIDPLPKNERYGFDQLIIRGIKQNLKIKAYPHKHFWLDIGNEEDYQKANEFFIKNKEKLLN